MGINTLASTTTINLKATVSIFGLMGPRTLAVSKMGIVTTTANGFQAQIVHKFTLVSIPRIRSRAVAATFGAMAAYTKVILKTTSSKCR